MKELIIRKQKNNHKGLDDTNHILCDENVLGAITGTFKKGESAFDIEHGIVYFYNHDNYVGMLWNVTKIETAESVEVKA